MNVLSNLIYEEERGGKVILTEDNWELWQKDFRAFVMNYPECQIWLEDEMKPAYRIQLRVQRFDENGMAVMEGNPPGPVFEENPRYAGQRGPIRLEDDEKENAKKADKLEENAGSVIGRCVRTIDERLWTRIELHDGYDLARSNRDILWFFRSARRSSIG